MTNAEHPLITALKNDRAREREARIRQGAGTREIRAFDRRTTKFVEVEAKLIAAGIRGDK